MKHAVCPVIEWPLILIGTMALCLGGILSVDLTIYAIAFVHSFGCMWEICCPSECSNSSPCLKHDSENFFCTSMPKIISVSGNLSQMMKLYVNLNGAILTWRAVIPNAVIGNPSAVFNVVVIGWIGVLKLSSMSWYVEYLLSDIAGPESMRALKHFPV